ncbi:putative histone deacetylase complex subunit cti6 [Lachnellula suecica]|uniref:Putative histone deacetylase complex subunit cti6 n=1 Tax=Lachnellula suecica TaxID=602035 RepID=A0A8T9BYN9_9HELO|nr:putative histone deacetylase complex subunit cti6 [Lachnellula suecica]
MDTARRSSRASKTQPSSTSSNSSSRGRATRQHLKSESTPSLSSEAPEEAVATRRKRADELDASSKALSETVEVDMANGTEDNDDSVRCICGFEDYPGPPELDDEENTHGFQDGVDEAIMFLQCDRCSAWQHGKCVSIMNESQSPDEYFCEECRPDLHKFFTDKNGQRFSQYLPLYTNLSTTSSRAGSFSKDGTRSPRGGSKSGRPSSSLQSAKRRSTMNSRDAAYDEEEQLRRAIEASKGEKSGESTDGGGTRRGKRGRSDSEEKPEDAKRQRTQSASPSPLPEQNQTPQAESDTETNGRQGGAKKIRGAAARNHREKELREERERSRLEAATKRKGRAERRRVDDSDPSEELSLATKVSVVKSTEVAAQPLDPPTSSQAATPDTPPPNPPSTSHRKGGRPPNSRKGKLGKNQYTKDRDLQEGDDHSPHRSQSREVPRGDDSGHPSGNKGSNNEGKAGKSKNSNSKITMGDMRKRVGAILDYISRTQLELAGESMSQATADAAEKTIRGIADGLPMIKVNGENGNTVSGGEEKESSKKEFKDLSCLEMMDVLTRQLVKWQKEFT